MAPIVSFPLACCPPYGTGIKSLHFYRIHVFRIKCPLNVRRMNTFPNNIQHTNYWNISSSSCWLCEQAGARVLYKLFISIGVQLNNKSNYLCVWCTLSHSPSIWLYVVESVRICCVILWWCCEVARIVYCCYWLLFWLWGPNSPQSFIIQASEKTFLKTFIRFTQTRKQKAMKPSIRDGAAGGGGGSGGGGGGSPTKQAKEEEVNESFFSLLQPISMLFL